MKKVFFGCSMRGGFPFVKQEFLKKIPATLEEMGLTLMSKHQTQDGILGQENQLTTKEIHDRDLSWLDACDFVIVELSNPSDGVGGEVADAVNLGKPVLGLYQRPEHEISAYIRGKLDKQKNCHHTRYNDLMDLKRVVSEFLEKIQ
jgi:nucleoside 2-deoxyribosyltransferase